MIEKEIYLTQIFTAQIKDTADFFEEYFKVQNMDEKQKTLTVECFVNALKTRLNIKQ